MTMALPTVDRFTRLLSPAALAGVRDRFTEDLENARRNDPAARSTAGSKGSRNTLR